MKLIDQVSTAVSILRHELSPDSAKIIRFSLARDQCYETCLQRVAFGVAIRNLLAKNGIFWEEVVVFNMWFDILKESIRTFTDKEAESTDGNVLMT